MDINSAINRGAKLLYKDFNWAYPGFYPYEFTSTKEEMLASRESAWIGIYLCNFDGMGGRIDLKGPDSVAFLNQTFVNRDFGNMRIGGSRHAIMCDDDGFIMGSGVIQKIADDHYRTSSLFFEAQVAASGLKVSVETVPEYWIQIDGPKSLEILEEACQSDLHDLGFAQNKVVRCADSDMFVHRLGMSGALAYEAHGSMEFYDAVYDAICTAGEKFGAKRQGIKNYCAVNHTPGGYPNQLIHFAYSDGQGGVFPPVALKGSAAGELANYLVTPYDIGWGNLVDFDHEFCGKEALQRISTSAHRTVVTLEWDLEDLGKLVSGEIAGIIDADEDVLDFQEGQPEWARMHVDLVRDGNHMVGVTSGRVRDWYHKTFVSLAFIDQDVAVEDKELVVLWGKAGGEQVPVRAKVARFPYYQGKWRNETCDVMAMIPERPYFEA